MDTEIEPVKEFIGEAVTVMALLVVPALSDNEVGETAREKSGGGAACTVSASVAVWVREPEVPVKVMVGEADTAVVAAVRVVVADGCDGVRVSVEGLAVTPEGSPVMDTEIEPVKEFIGEAVTVMALLVVPGLRDSEVGETATEKSGGTA
jgi:hypothetical protein